MNTPEHADGVEPTARTEHRMERRIEVAATPEQVWDAIATADGIAAWMVPTELDPRVGGAVSFHMDDMTSTGVVTDYSPPHRIAYEEPWPLPDRAEDVPTEMVDWLSSMGITLSQVYESRQSVGPIATEFLVEARSGGSCVIRVVTSSYGTGADWEHEFFSEMVNGWSELLDNLATHLGRPA